MAGRRPRRPREAAAFPGTVTSGCTTAGELASGRVLQKSVVAMSLGPEEIGTLHVEVARRVHASAEAGVKAALGRFESRVGGPLAGLRRDRWAGIVLTDGLSVAEERIMETLSDATSLAFVGGSAGDDLAFR